jgi:oligosaccharide repeat unit polymerase
VAARTQALSQTSKGGFWASGYLLLGGVVAPLILLHNSVWADDYLPLVWVAGLMFVCLAMYDWKRTGQVLTTGGILAFGGFLLFFLRALTVDVDGTTTAGALAQTQYFAGPVVTAGTAAIVQVIAFYLMVGGVYFARTLHHHPQAVPTTRESPSDLCIRRARHLLSLVTVLALLLTLYLVQGAGGISAYFKGVAVRSSFFAGHYYLTLGYVPLGVALVLYIIMIRNRPGVKIWTPLPVFSALVLLLCAFATGGRGPLILGGFLPLLLLKQIGPKPLRAVRLGVVSILVIIAALVMSLTLRFNAFDKGASDQALRQNPVSTLLDQLTSGDETRPFDSLILLNYESGQHLLTYQFGITYAKAATWFIPGALDPGKDNGANTWFTKTYLPTFYYPDKIETSISAIGEAYANFSWPGIVIVGLLLGFAAGSFARRERRSLRDDVLFVLVTPLFFSFVRGDSFANLPLFVVTIVLAHVFINITGSTRRGAGRRSSGDLPIEIHQ